MKLNKVHQSSQMISNHFHENPLAMDRNKI